MAPDLRGVFNVGHNLNPPRCEPGGLPMHMSNIGVLEVSRIEVYIGKSPNCSTLFSKIGLGRHDLLWVKSSF